MSSTASSWRLASTRPLELGIVAGSGALLLALTLGENSATRIFAWPWFLCWQGIALAPGFIIILRELRGRPSHRIGEMWDIGLLGLAAAAILSGLCSSYRWPSLSLATVYLFIVGVVYIIFSWVRSNPDEAGYRLDLLGHAVGAVLAMVAIASLSTWIAQDASTSLLFKEGAVRNARPFGHSTYTAGFAALAAPWLAGLAWRSTGWARAGWATCAALALVILPTTSSRAGAVGAGIILTVIAFLIWSRSPSARWKRWLPAAAVFVGMLLLISDPRLRHLLTSGEWSGGAVESNRQRSAMLQGGILMGQTHPIFGYGPGTIPFVYPLFRHRLAGGVENVLQVHSTPIQLWAELGLLGIACAGAIAAAALFAVFRGWKRLRLRALVEPTTIYRVAAITSLLAYIPIALTDYQLDVPLIGILIALDLSILALFCDDSKSALKIPRFLLSGFLCLLIVPTLPSITGEALAKAENSRAYNALSRRDEDSFIRFNDSATRCAPWDPHYTNEIASYLMQKRRAATSADEKDRLAREIISRLHASAQVDANQEYVAFNLGWLSLELSRPADAIRHFETAARLVPDKGGVYLGIALATLGSNSLDRAINGLALESTNDPLFLSSPWWKLEPIAALKLPVARRISEMRDVARKLPACTPNVARNLDYTAALAQWILNNGPATELAALATREDQKEYLAKHDQPSDLQRGETMVYRRQRLGYPVLYRHPEMTPPVDEYEVQENAAAAAELRFLFPPKGWLPAPVLVELSRRFNTRS